MIAAQNVKLNNLLSNKNERNVEKSNFKFTEKQKKWFVEMIKFHKSVNNFFP